MKFMTVSDLKKDAANLDVEDGAIVTQNGLPVYHVETFEAYQQRCEAVALLKLTALSITDSKSSIGNLRDKLKQRKELIGGAK